MNMKINSIIKVALSFLGCATLFFSLSAEKLVILHTNDTHSSIEPLPDGTSGILQRKAILDSVRSVEKNVITVDAGDAVQGTLYFKYFNGEVEYPLMNMSGYDIRILGNHEFDNGTEELAHFYKQVEGTPLSANYDFTGTPLDGVFYPYILKEYGGKKVGFFGINIDPSSIIAAKNIDFKYKDILPVADSIASLLRNDEGCELVVCVTHIGYDKINEKITDVELAQQSKNIDIIIGGHTHTLIDPDHPEINPSLIKNADGRNVRIGQTGKQGRFIGKMEIDLDNLHAGTDGSAFEYSLIPVTDRFPESQLDAEMMAFLAPYRERVDSVDNVVVAHAAYDLPKERQGGLPNLTADFGYEYTNAIADSIRKLHTDFPRVDLAIMNVGGIRHPMPKGDITEGQILSTYPFSNRVVIIEVKGKDIIEALRVSAMKGGEAVSENVKVVTAPDGKLLRVVLNGCEMNPDENYVVGTIDYVAEGNDDLISLARHKKLWEGDQELSVPILQWFKNQTVLGLPVNPDPRERFIIDESYRIDDTNIQ